MKRSYLFLFLGIFLIFSLVLISGQEDKLQLNMNNLLELEQVCINFVYDGDTVRTDTGEKIRLIGVDTPEMNWEEGEPELYAREAYEYTKENLLGQLVYLEYDEEKKDKYDRTLAYLYLADGTLFNQRLLEEGYATLLLIPPNLKYSEVLKEAEVEARSFDRGIWSSFAEN